MWPVKLREGGDRLEKWLFVFLPENFLCVAPSRASQNEVGRPNFILILCDDWLRRPGVLHEQDDPHA